MRNVRLEVIRARMEQGKKYKAKLKYLTPKDSESEYFTVASVVYHGGEPSVYLVYFHKIKKFPLSHRSVYDWKEIE